MEGSESGEQFLHRKYKDLNTDPTVVSAANRHARRLGMEPPEKDDYGTRIKNYLDRLSEIVNPPKVAGEPDTEQERKRDRNLSMLKTALYNNFVIKPGNIPESYFDAIKRKHREEGYGDIEIPDDYRRELSETIIADQRNSLDNWVDYLVSDDAKYPNWLKYLAFRSVLRMGRYDKQRKTFTERTSGGGTVSPFPELNREALSIVLGDMEKKNLATKESQSSRLDLDFTSRFDISLEAKQKYMQSLDNGNFAQAYALAIEEFKPIAEELLQITQGEWVRYPRGSDHLPLVRSISNYGTGWCLRGEATAQRYLTRDKNDLFVYYSLDLNGKPTVPRVCNRKSQF
ncbi:MAG: hypothetical protein G01um10147_541 [Microgenomates group bacterium Gr01-1014_7]|nr:MAG: hypothetical protein G01um10147_541 [Microgenomates group bacterium Gr01-1014_7]